MVFRSSQKYRKNINLYLIERELFGFDIALLFDANLRQKLCLLRCLRDRELNGTTSRPLIDWISNL